MKHLSEIQYWQEMKNEIICGDALEVLKMIPDKEACLVLTDPPYRDEKENQATKDMRKNNWKKDFGDRPTKEVFEQIFRVSKNQIIWGANNFDLPTFKGFIVYKKKTISLDFTMSMAEIAFISEGLGTVSKVVEYAPQEPNRKHPTQKPLELARWCIQNYAPEAKLIVDPFGGSFTFARACKDFGIDFISCDLEEEYCKIGEERMRQNNLF